MTHELTGRIYGKRIELDDDPGLPAGQPVVVFLEPVSTDPGINPKTNRPWGEGFHASAGAFADDPDADRIIEEILAERKRT